MGKVTFKPYLDIRRKDGDKPVNMMIVLVKDGKSAMLPVGIKMSPSLWDKGRGRVVDCPQKTLFEKAIYDRMYEVQEALSSLAYTEGVNLSDMTVCEIKDIVRDKLDGVSVKRRETFSTCYKDVVKDKSGRTRELYEITWKRIEDFAGKNASLSFEDVNVEWLRRFDVFLSQRSPSPNARGVHFKHIRAVFNYAISREQTSLYPFRIFKIASEPTAKRSLSVADIRKIATMPLLGWQELYRDIFMLDFYLIGINIVDLFKLTYSNIQNGRLVYRRSKTKRLYSIKIEPEAQAILDRHRGESHLLDVADRYKDHKIFISQLNKSLKTLGTWETTDGCKHKVTYHPFWQSLSSYWARHSWATIAYNDCDIPLDIISQALGHTMGTSNVTMVYVNADSKKVDAANRKVIDCVLGKVMAHD